MGVASVDLKLLDHGVAKRPLGQHALHGDLERPTWEFVLHLPEVGLVNAAGVARVTKVFLIGGLRTRHAQFVCVHHDDVIAGIDVGGEFRLVLTAQA